MARSKADIYAQAARILPYAYHGGLPYMGGHAAALASAEGAVEDLADSTLIGGASGAWLDLVGDGEGIGRTSSESDAIYRTRLRDVEDAVTYPAIDAAVDAAAGANAYQLVEHWQVARFLRTTGGTDYVGDMYLDGRTILTEPLAISAVVDQGLGDAVEQPILAAMERLRAAGVRAYLISATGLVVTTFDYPWETA